MERTCKRREKQMNDEEFCDFLLDVRYGEERVPSVDEEVLDNFDWDFVTLTNDCDNYDEKV